jgi:outer membrane lipoprotein SlyB
MVTGSFRVLRSARAVGAALALALAVTACENPNNSAPIRQASAERPGAVAGSGRIIGIQPAGSQPGSSSGIGMIGGGLAGGAAGAAIGRGRAGILTGIAGAIGGALIGNAIERSMSRNDDTEFVVERDDGQIVNVQQRDDQNLQTGDRVNLIQQGGRMRVVPAGPGPGPSRGPGPGRG